MGATEPHAYFQGNASTRLEYLLRPGTHPVVLSQVYPTHHSGRIQEKLGWPGYVVSFDSRTGVHKVVAANGLRARIGQEGKTVSSLLRRDLARPLVDPR